MYVRSKEIAYLDRAICGWKEEKIVYFLSLVGSISLHIKKDDSTMHEGAWEFMAKGECEKERIGTQKERRMWERENWYTKGETHVLYY